MLAISELPVTIPLKLRLNALVMIFTLARLNWSSWMYSLSAGLLEISPLTCSHWFLLERTKSRTLIARVFELKDISLFLLTVQEESLSIKSEGRNFSLNTGVLVYDT